VAGADQGAAVHHRDAEATPTTQSYQVFQELSGQLDREMAALDQVWAQDLDAFNRLLRANRLPAVTRTPLAIDEEGGTASRQEEAEEEGEEERRRW